MAQIFMHEYVLCRNSSATCFSPSRSSSGRA